MRFLGTPRNSSELLGTSWNSSELFGILGTKNRIIHVMPKNRQTEPTTMSKTEAVPSNRNNDER